MPQMRKFGFSSTTGAMVLIPDNIQLRIFAEKNILYTIHLWYCKDLDKMDGVDSF